MDKTSFHRSVELGQDGTPEYLSTTHREYPWPQGGGRQEAIDSRARQAVCSVVLGMDGKPDYVSNTHASYKYVTGGRQEAIDSRKVQAKCSVVLGHDGPPDFNDTTYKRGFPLREGALLERPDNVAISNELNRTKFVLGTDAPSFDTTYRTGFSAPSPGGTEMRSAGVSKKGAEGAAATRSGAPMPSTVVLGTDHVVVHREELPNFMPHLSEYKRSSPVRALTGMAVPPPPGFSKPIDAFVVGYDKTVYETANMEINRYCALKEAYLPALTPRLVKEHPALDFQKKLEEERAASMGASGSKLGASAGKA